MTDKKKIKRKESSEIMIYGKEAVLALWKQRSEDIVRVYATEERLGAVKNLLKWCAEQKKAYHVVSNEDMDKITNATHHGGVAALSKKRRFIDFTDFLKTIKEPLGPIIFLDGVVNPHNIGAIARTMAHFGSSYLLGAKKTMPEFSPSSMRISEGGSEWVDLVLCQNPIESLLDLKKIGYSIIALSQRSQKTIYEHKLPKKSVFIFGSELEGLSKDILKIVDQTTSIPGTSKIESLNVSVSCGICLSEWYRFHV